MDKRELSIVVILVFSLFIAFSVLPSVQASTFYVPDDYATIQVAVDAASHGDTIIVRDGTYIENIEVNKRLTIRSENGPDSTFVRAENPGYDVISVTADHVTMSGFTVEGATDAAGISPFYADYCNISNNNCLNNYHGISIANSNENRIANNICASNLLAAIFILSSANNKLSGNGMRESGIWFDSDSIVNYTHEIDESNTVNGKPVYYWNDVTGGRVPDDAGQVILVNCTNVAVEDQNVNNASIGIEVAFSSDIAIINNTCSYNKYAIILSYSTNNKLNGNVMVDDGILIHGNSLGDYTHEIDTSNTINEKPVYYWQNVDGGRVPDGAGQVIVANCTNIIIEDQNVTNASVGIAVAFSSDISIRNNICSYNRFGILFDFSNNNRIERNTANTNSLDGIRLRFHSNNNKISNNTCSSNEYGIYLFVSTNNSITNSNCSDNKNTGIYLKYSNNNTITDNEASKNIDRHGISLETSQNNEIVGNNVNSNLQAGIALFTASENIIANNTAKDNGYGGIYLGDSKNNDVAGNSANLNLQVGIALFTASENIIANNTVENNEGDGIHLQNSKNNEIAGNTADSNLGVGVVLWSSDENIIANNRAKNNGANGVYLVDSNNNNVTNSNCASNNKSGIHLTNSSTNRITDNVAANNNNSGIFLSFSDNNEIRNNCANDNHNNGTKLMFSDENVVANNTAKNNGDSGIYLAFSDGNRITDNEASSNVNAGISLSFSDANTIYLNNFVDNLDNAVSLSRNTTWHSPSTMTYTYHGNTYSRHVGNYWGDYKGSDSDGDGIGDSSYSIDGDADFYPLMEPWANYFA